MKTPSFRAFFAIDIPEDIQKIIATAMHPLHTSHNLQEIRWVKPKNLHLTLCFLGNITEQQYETINQKIKKITKPFGPFPLKLTTLEPFPSAKEFNVLSLKLQPAIALMRLVRAINQGAKTSGIQFTTRCRFKPHITLGHICNQDKINRKIFTEIKLPPISFVVTAIKLFRSESQPGGSIYTPVATYDLI